MLDPACGSAHFLVEVVEELAGVALVVMQADRDAGTRVDEEHGVTLLLGTVMGKRDRHPVHPEDPLVPLSAGLHIGHGRREVMEAGDGRYRGGLGQGRLLRRPVVADAILARSGPVAAGVVS